MKHLFLNYELAVLAKEKGFDEPCLVKYCGLTILNQQIIDWFEEKHKILIWAQRSAGGSWIAKYVNDYGKTHIGSGNFTYYDEERFVDNGFEGFNSKQEALTATIHEAFKLI